MNVIVKGAASMSLAAALILSAAANSSAQVILPPVPIPPPPLTEEAISRVQECRRLQELVERMTSEDMEEREQATREAREIVTRERMRLLQQAIEDSSVRGEQPGPPREEVDRRLQELLPTSCIFQILFNALKHGDGEVRARARVLMDRLDPPSRRPAQPGTEPRNQVPERETGPGQDAAQHGRW